VEGDVIARIREMGPPDHPVWVELSHALFPDERPSDLLSGIVEMTADGGRGFLAEVDGAPAGFAELSQRAYANGCSTRPVGFLEAIYVAPQHRRRGVGRALVAHLQNAARAQGLRELGSDALIDNAGSLAAHAAWGFAETERVVCFVKPV
jgi:aminoglycoside 6'-N-acetyltransferase I